MSEKISDEFQRKSKPGGSNQAGRPEIFGKNHQNTLTGAEQTKPEPVQKESPRVAVGPCRPASLRPAIPTCWPFSGPLLRTHGLPLLLPVPSWFCTISFKFLLTKIK